MNDYSKWIFRPMMVLVVIMTAGCHKKVQPTIGEEMQQMREMILPYSVIYCIPDSNKEELLYFDTEKQEYDMSRDVNGQLFTSDVLPAAIGTGEYYLDWNEDDYIDSYAIIDSIITLYISCNTVPEIADLEQYFSDVPTCVLMPTEGGCLDGVVDSVARPLFMEMIHRLQLYKDGKNDVFPMDLVEYVRENEQYLSCYLAHAGDMPEEIYPHLFQYRLMQQIAYICPDITMIANNISGDGRLAVDDIYSTSDFHIYNTDIAYIFLRLPDGRYATYVVSVYPGEVFVLTDADTDDYTIYRVGNEYLQTYTTVLYDKKKQKWQVGEL